MNPIQRLMLVRHGETEWSLNGRHTSTTDLPLTTEGERRAAILRPLLDTWHFELVLCSPRQRARRTCELIGKSAQAEITDDLAEWNYGDYEGLTTREITTSAPGWTVFLQPCPGGESAADVAARIDRVIERVRTFGGDALLVGHGHSLRVLAARWLGLEPEAGRFFSLQTGTWSILGYEHSTPVIQVWSALPETSPAR